MEWTQIFASLKNHNLLVLKTWWISLLYSVLLLAYAANIAVFANQTPCGDERTKWGFALENHTYKSVHADNFAGCLLVCNQDKHCRSFNFWWNILKCEFNNVTKYSAPKSFICKVNCVHRDMFRTKATLYRSCNEVHPSCGDGEYFIDPTSSGDPFTVYCDTTTDGGGWTAIQRLTLEENTLYLTIDTFWPSTYKGLSFYNNSRMEILSTILLQLRQDMGYKQIRFYCHKNKVGTVFHIMTNINPLGEAVVQYFTDDTLVHTRPEACGSYTVLPDDNSTLSEDCSMWGTNGSMTDGKWGMNSSTDQFRIYGAVVRGQTTSDGSHHDFHDFHDFASYPMHRQCDDYSDWSEGESSLSVGDTWALYVR